MVEATVEQLNPNDVRHNPENPRLIFREDLMNQLLDSIQNAGILVPVTVYRDGRHFRLLDGERRWRCAIKLNLPKIPAIIQPKPERLENILMMFNIHNVRAEWELIAIAKKLKDIQTLLEKAGKPASAKDLAALTGTPLATVRSAFELLDLPKKYQTMLLKEAEKPKTEQRITPYLFIEIYKSLRVSRRYLPELFEEHTPAEFVDEMVQKYRRGVVDSVVAYRQVSKIARAERAGVDKDAALPVLSKLISQRDYSIKRAYEDSVQTAYERRDVVTKALALSEKLGELKGDGELAPDLVAALERLRREIDRLLRS